MTPEQEGFTIRYEGVVERGFRFASGKAENNRFGVSTIGAQIPIWKEKGFDIGRELPGYYLGTLNVFTPGLWLLMTRPDLTLRDVDWCASLPIPEEDKAPPETFHLTHCKLEFNREVRRGFLWRRKETVTDIRDGLIYYPEPFGKPDPHEFQRIEVITTKLPMPWPQPFRVFDRFLNGEKIRYGSPAAVWVKPGTYLELTPEKPRQPRL